MPKMLIEFTNCNCIILLPLVANFSVQPAVSVLENQDASVCITLDGPPAGLGRNVTLNVTTTDGLATGNGS